MVYSTKKLNRQRNNTNVLKKELKSFIRCIVEQILNFYCIQLRQNDLKRDLVENMVTNMVLKDEVYAIMFRMYSELHDENIQLLKEVQDNEQLLATKLNLEKL